jgi:hypothetical protein
MVSAKRRRNQQFMQESGLLGTAQAVQQQHATKRNKRNKSQNQHLAKAQRRSHRLNPNDISIADVSSMNGDMPEFYANRINDGAPMTLEQVAVQTNYYAPQENIDSMQMNALTALVRTCNNRTQMNPPRRSQRPSLRPRLLLP